MIRYTESRGLAVTPESGSEPQIVGVQITVFRAPSVGPEAKSPTVFGKQSAVNAAQKRRAKQLFLATLFAGVTFVVCLTAWSFHYLGQLSVPYPPLLATLTVGALGILVIGSLQLRNLVVG
jgi:hypothetical protein